MILLYQDCVSLPVGIDLFIASDRGLKKRQRAEGDSGWATVREGLKNEEEEEPVDEKPQVVEDKPFRGGLTSAEQPQKMFKKHTLGNTTDTRGNHRSAGKSVS